MDSNRPLRVLMLTNYFLPGYQGGAEVACYNTSRGLRAAGHDVRVMSITTRLPEAADRSYEVGGVPVRNIAIVRRWRSRYLDAVDPVVVRRVLAVIDKFRPDIIHTHNVSGSSLAPFVAAAWRKIPVVATLHDIWLLCANNMLYRNDGHTCGLEPCDYQKCFKQYDYWAAVPARRRLFQRMTGHVQTFISPSQCLIDLHVERGYDPARFALVRHGMYPLSRTLDDSGGGIGSYHQDANTMVFVGAVVLTKGIHIVMRALPHIIREIPDFRLLVAGWGAPELVSQLRAFGSHVALLGTVPRAEIVEVFAGAGLTVMASIINENSPLAVHESLLAGTPVLGARIGGIPELIENGRTGYLYDPEEAAELATSAIAHYRRPARERRAMRRACVEYASREFSMERHTSQTVEIYRAAIAGPAAFDAGTTLNTQSRQVIQCDCSM